MVFDFKGEIISINLFNESGDYVAINTIRSGLFHSVSAMSFKANSKMTL